GRREGERLQLLGNRSRYFDPAVTSGGSEKPGAAIQNLAPRRSPVVHAACTLEQAWLTLELAIVGEGHPMAFQTLERHFHFYLRASRSRGKRRALKGVVVWVLSAKSGPDLRRRRPQPRHELDGTHQGQPGSRSLHRNGGDHVPVPVTHRHRDAGNT